MEKTPYPTAKKQTDGNVREDQKNTERRPYSESDRGQFSQDNNQR